MKFDIINFSEDRLSRFTVVQMQILRTAQKKKNELIHNYNLEGEIYLKMIMGNGTRNSTLYSQKLKALKDEVDYQVSILCEQLLYSIEINEPMPDDNVDQQMVGYVVDYSLMYADRYAIVREYYMSIDDPALRMKLYTDDDVAKTYLGSYYTVLYNVLYTYSRT